MDAWDLFLSYSNGDDVPPPEVGWVSDFQRRLGQRIRVVSGLAPNIWFDKEQHRHNDRLDEIELCVQRSRCLVSIVSPSHVQSGWCKRELEAFVRTPGRAVDRHVFKVVKYPPGQRVALHDAFDGMVGYKFHDKFEGVDVELDPTQDKRYLIELTRLAQDIVSRLTTPRAKVFVGSTGDREASETREATRSELVARGFAVLPEHLPVARSLREAALVRAIEDAEIAAFVVGREHDDAFWQLLERARSRANVPCLAYLPAPSTLTDNDTRQAEALAALRADPRGAELYEANRYGAIDFQRAILEHADWLAKQPPVAKLRLSILFDARRQAVVDRVLARTSGAYEPEFPGQSGAATEFRQAVRRSQSFLVITGEDDLDYGLRLVLRVQKDLAGVTQAIAKVIAWASDAEPPPEIEGMRELGWRVVTEASLTPADLEPNPRS